MKECVQIRNEFSDYLDGAVTGAAMQRIAGHLEKCPGCAAEFSDWRNAQTLLSSVGPAKAPEISAFVFASHSRRRLPIHVRQKLDRWRVRWQNTVRPLVLQASAGLASTILLLGSVSLLVGMLLPRSAVGAGSAFGHGFRSSLSVHLT